MLQQIIVTGQALLHGLRLFRVACQVRPHGQYLLLFRNSERPEIGTGGQGSCFFLQKTGLGIFR